MSNLAVAANPPVPTGHAPATAGVSSLTVAPADVAGGRDQVFSFPVTIFATAAISGTIEDEARNTIGCDLRDALADESSVDLDNGGTLSFTSFKVERGFDAIEARLAAEAHAAVAALRWLTKAIASPDVSDAELVGLLVANGPVRLQFDVVQAMVAARKVLASIDGEA